MRLVHNAIDNTGYIIERPHRDEVLQHLHQTFVEMWYRDVGNHREEKENEREQGHKEVERHARRTVDGTAFGEELDEVGEHVKQRHLSTRKTHPPEEVVVLMIPSLQFLIFSLDPHIHCHYNVQN